MNSISKKQLYAFELDDYAAPTCTSFTKRYFGTIDDFKAVLDGIDEKRKVDELRETFERFVAGERKIIYHAGQSIARFATPAEIIKEKEISLGCINYKYENSYGFYYFLRITKAEGKVALVKLGKKFYIVYWMTVTNPRYHDEVIDKRKWYPLGDTIWGFPGMMKIKGKTMTNLLGMIDSAFNTEKEAMEHYDGLQVLDWNRFFEDVFGDG